MATASMADLEKRADEVAGFLMAAANRNRLMILCQLAEAGELPVGTLAERLGLSQPALSQHLARMTEEGLVYCRPEGQKRFYALAGGPVTDLLQVLKTHFCQPQ